jgi:hypothetical protein
MTNSPAERRRAPRVLADFPIRLTGDGTTREGKLRDLSEIGLCCSYPIEIEEMTQVRIGLQIPGDDRLLPVEGAVVRCDRVGAEFEVAVYFTGVPAETKDALHGWIGARPGEASAGA